jgi:uncharacterized protein YbjT (DUF2867 family)
VSGLDDDVGAGARQTAVRRVRRSAMVGNGRIVVVTGVTGRQGGAVARHLLTDGRRVRGVTRSPSSPPAQALAGLGVELAPADMADRDRLRAVCDGAHGVFSVQNPMISGEQGELIQGRNVVDAAADAGVAHVVYGSAGPGIPNSGVAAWDVKQEIAEYARGSGVPLTVLRPMAFMELMTDKAFFPAVAMWHLMPKLMGPQRPVPWICVDDMGAIAARAFSDPDGVIGKDIKVAAEVRSIEECRAVWSAVKGRSPRHFPMPVWMFERFTGTDLTTMWRWLREGHIDIDPSQTHQILPTVSTVRQWLERRSTEA